MRILIDMGHPAHVHFFKNFIRSRIIHEPSIILTDIKLDSDNCLWHAGVVHRMILHLIFFQRGQQLCNGDEHNIIRMVK